MEGIDINAIIASGAPWSLVGLCIVAIIRGDLIPRVTYVDQLHKRDLIITDMTDERDYYRARNEQLTGATETYAEFLADRQTRSMLQRPNLQRDRGSP